MVDSIEDVLKKYQDGIMKLRYVVGVGIGEKRVGGRNTHRPCIAVFVEKKMPLSQLNAEDRIPSELEGFPTDVLQTGRFRPLSP